MDIHKRKLDESKRFLEDKGQIMYIRPQDPQVFSFRHKHTPRVVVILLKVT